MDPLNQRASGRTQGGRTQGSRAQGGFTLMELVIAAAVLAIAFLGLYTAWSEVLDSVEGLRGAARLRQSGQAILYTVQADLEGAVPATDKLRAEFLIGGEAVEGAFDPASAQWQRGERQGRVLLDLVTRADPLGELDDLDEPVGPDGPGGFPKRAAHRVQYVLRVPAGSGLSGLGSLRLIRKERPDVLLRDRADWREVELSSSVVAARGFATAPSGTVQPFWDSGSEQTEGRLPGNAGVELQLARGGRSWLGQLVVDFRRGEGPRPK